MLIFFHKDIGFPSLLRREKTNKTIIKNTNTTTLKYFKVNEKCMADKGFQWSYKVLIISQQCPTK